MLNIIVQMSFYLKIRIGGTCFSTSPSWQLEHGEKAFIFRLKRKCRLALVTQHHLI